MLPPLGNGARYSYNHFPIFLPMSMPPMGAVETAKIPHPIGSEMFWWIPSPLVPKTGCHYPEPAAGLHEPHQIPKVEIIGPKVMIGIQTDHRVKEPLGERQAMGLSPDGKDPVGHT